MVLNRRKSDSLLNSESWTYSGNFGRGESPSARAFGGLDGFSVSVAESRLARLSYLSRGAVDGDLKDFGEVGGLEAFGRIRLSAKGGGAFLGSSAAGKAPPETSGLLKYGDEDEAGEGGRGAFLGASRSGVPGAGAGTDPIICGNLLS